MPERTKHLAIAVLLTILDTAVTWHYGDALWSAGSGIICARLLLILLFAMMLTSLLRVWYRAGYAFRRIYQERSREAAPAIIAVPDVLRGEGDV